MPDTSGLSSSTPFAFYDPDSRSLRTSQGTFLLDSTPCSVTLPPSGSMRSGALFERPTLGPATNASDCSSPRGIPTPTARLGDQRGAQAKRYLNPERSNDLDDWVAFMLLPTPTARDHKDGTKVEAVEENGLLGRVAWRLLPTPTSGDAKFGVGGNTPGANYGVVLTNAVQSLGATSPPPSTGTPDSSDGPLPLPPMTEDD